MDDPIRQGYYNFAIDPTDPSRLYFAVYGKGVYVSNDGAGSQMPLFGKSNEMRGKLVTAVVVDPTDSDTIYVGSEEGVFITSDRGDTWSTFNSSLDTGQARTLAMTADGTLLCGTLGYELYYYDILDNGWRQLASLGNFGTLWPIWDDRPLYHYTSLLVDPTDNQTVYMGSFPAGVYKTTDGGKTWRERNVGWTNDGVFSLVFHPEDIDIIYAGTYNGVNRSTNGGEHWEMWDNGWPPEQWVFSIVFDPRDPDVMYACSKNGEEMGRGREGFHGTVMKSVDGGATWFEITNGLNVVQEFYKLIVDPVSLDTLYLATQGDGVFISHDGGARWAPWNEGLTNLMAATNGNNVTNVLALSADDDVLYFGTMGSGVWRRGLEH